jgi:hypothetical protein
MRKISYSGLPEQVVPGKPHVALVGGHWYVIDGIRTILGPSVRWCSEFLRP